MKDWTFRLRVFEGPAFPIVMLPAHGLQAGGTLWFGPAPRWWKRLIDWILRRPRVPVGTWTVTSVSDINHFTVTDGRDIAVRSDL